MSNKNLLSLNGEWSYLKDSNSQFNYEVVKNAYLSKELNKVFIPSNWYLTEIGDFAGVVWFIIEFDYRNDKNYLVILQFNGIDYSCEVYLNDFFIGSHEGYFQKFYFNVSDKISWGKNLLIVKVVSEREDIHNSWPHKKKLIKGIFSHHDCRPGGWDPEHGQDRNTGGIWNDVILYSHPSIYVTNLKVFPKILYQENLAYITFELQYYMNSGGSSFEELHVFIKFKDEIVWRGTLNISNIANNTVNFTAEIVEPHLWWPYEIGEPSLYQLQVFIRNELIFSSNFGIREIELRNSIFHINNKRLFLRGTNVIPEQMLSLLKKDKIENLVNLLKESNINIVRVHAHVNRQEFYDYLDREGILVWQDFALQWTYDDSQEFISNAVSQIKDMVKQFHSHPSIVFWCCHNEPGEQIHKLDEFLYQAVLNEDNSRIIRKASNYEEHCYEGWYWGKIENFIAIPSGPLVTEFGAQALPNKNSLIRILPENQFDKPESKIWEYHNFQYEQTFHIAKIDRGNSIDDFIENSQTYQANLLKKAIHYYRRKKYSNISGIFQFMFIDCWESISWSVIDYFGEKKKAFFILKNSYNPLLLSVELLQDIYSTLSRKFNLELWIINDFHKEFSNHSLLFFLNEREIYLMKIDKIESDSIIHLSSEKLSIKIPEWIESGNHRLKIELRDEKMNLISYEEFEIEFRTI